MGVYEFTVMIVAEGESSVDAWDQAVEDMRDHIGSGSLHYVQCVQIEGGE